MVPILFRGAITSPVLALTIIIVLAWEVVCRMKIRPADNLLCGYMNSVGTPLVQWVLGD